MSYGNRIKEIRQALGKTQVEFAKDLDISVMALSRLETDGSSLRVELISKITKFDINSQWLITGQGEMFLKDISSPDAPYGIPVLEVAAAAGDGQVNETEIQIATFYVAEEFRKYWGPCTKAIRIAGDSMEPTIPRNGWVLVRETTELLPEGIFVFLQDNELRCKRIQKKVNGDVIIISDNSEHYDKEVYPLGQLLTQISVIAEVIGVLRRP